MTRTLSLLETNLNPPIWFLLLDGRHVVAELGLLDTPMDSKIL